MEEKKYYCRNGDLIEVGKDYINDDGEKLKLLYINDNPKVDWPVKVIFIDGGITNGSEVVGFKFGYLASFVSLVKEPPKRIYHDLEPMAWGGVFGLNLRT